MGHFSSKLAREVGRLTGWKEKVFGRRYQAIVVSDEEAAQLERFRYGLAHGCKEDLVERPRDWPGVHAVRALLEGEILEGLWFDRTREYMARRRGETFDRLQFATREVLELDPLPCWKHLPEEERRRRTASLVDGIEAEATARRKRTGARPLGPAAVLAQDPLRQPERTKKSPAPAFHAASQAVRRELRGFYAEFVAAYREAAAKLRAGVRDVVFPIGSLPPALPFEGGKAVNAVSLTWRVSELWRSLDERTGEVCPDGLQIEDAGGLRRQVRARLGSGVGREGACWPSEAPGSGAVGVIDAHLCLRGWNLFWEKSGISMLIYV
jgi:hypothetical protein